MNRNSIREIPTSTKIPPERPNVIEPGYRRWGRAQWDRIIDSYKATGKPQEPTVCPQCGAVYHEGRWQWAPAPANAARELCRACHRINDKFPAGSVTLTGPFVAAHKDEMIRIARNEEQTEKRDHPLNRIMSIEQPAPDRLEISTTDIHLPRRIGEVVKRAYHGEMNLHFDEHGYFVRVNWRREK